MRCNKCGSEKIDFYTTRGRAKCIECGHKSVWAEKIFNHTLDEWRLYLKYENYEFKGDHLMLIKPQEPSIFTKEADILLNEPMRVTEVCFHRMDIENFLMCRNFILEVDNV